MRSPAPIVLLPAYRFPIKLGPNAPNNIPRNPPFCFFASFLIILLTSFINKSDSPGDLTIFMISFICSFKIINSVTPDPNISLSIVFDGIKTLLGNGLSTSPIKGNPVFSKSLPKNSPDCLVVFEFLIILY